MRQSSNLSVSGQRTPVVNTTARRAHRKVEKPPKPYPEFPLTAHPSGNWCKKIRQKLHYFGKWGERVDGKLQRIDGDGWEAALELYKAQADDLHAGRKPRPKGEEGFTVRDACNAFLIAKEAKRDSGELTARTFAEYRATTDRIIATFGATRLVDNLAADDFNELRASIARVWGPWRLSGEIQRVRTVFKFCYESGLIDRPVRYGPEFKKPSKRTMRVHRASAGSRMLTQTECKALIDGAGVPLKAMILLGLNSGFGNGDCASLPLSAMDLARGWITFPRPKTGLPRRCPLWKETVDALQTAIAERPQPKDEASAGLIFITKYKAGWHSKTSGCPVSAEFRKLADELGIYRPGVSFYSLRHVFRTIADETHDTPAIRLVMGHGDGSIDDTYREHIADDRLQAVTAKVHAWLFPPKATAKRKGGAK